MKYASKTIKSAQNWESTVFGKLGSVQVIARAQNDKLAKLHAYLKLYIVVDKHINSVVQRTESLSSAMFLKQEILQNLNSVILK